MVMDATPSPHSVGREFVRQYYTLLNRAPDHLHRFYNNQSSFVHGGLERDRESTIVVGQKQIHNKIQQLNFRDCHAKISQVDAQATLGSGVVVQVTGELSNDGQPMRRFTQTFVLAAQSPKKYYVHNDIFRYQDYYTDEEGDAESRSENDEDAEAEQIPTVADASQSATPAGIVNQSGGNQQIFYPIGVTQIPGQPLGLHGFGQQTNQLNGVVHDDMIHGIEQSTTPNPTHNAGINNVEIPAIQTATTTTPAGPIANTEVTEIKETNTNATVTEKQKDNDTDRKKDNLEATEIEKIDEVAKPVSQEPKTYANLFKTETNSSSGFNSISSPSLPAAQTNRTERHSSSSGIQYSRSHDTKNENNVNSANRPITTRSMKDSTTERRSSNANNFGDNHQLFLGNLPHHASEDELRALFSKFGTVVDLRILSKQSPKLSGAKPNYNPPNYGFLAYEDPESVQNCLASTPLYFPEDGPDDQRTKLNIEEKKTRIGSGNRIPNNLGGSNPNSMRNTSNSGGPNRNGSNSNGQMRSGGGSGTGGGMGNGGNMRGSSARGNFNRNDRGPGGLSRGNNTGSVNLTGNSYGRR